MSGLLCSHPFDNQLNLGGNLLIAFLSAPSLVSVVNFYNEFFETVFFKLNFGLCCFSAMTAIWAMQELSQNFGLVGKSGDKGK